MTMTLKVKERKTAAHLLIPSLASSTIPQAKDLSTLLDVVFDIYLTICK